MYYLNEHPMTNKTFLEQLDLNYKSGHAMPSVHGTQSWVHEMYRCLFPIKTWSSDLPSHLWHNLENQLLQLLDYEGGAAEKQKLFFEQMHVVYQKLKIDLVAFLASDPAAQSETEVIASYPGFFAIAIHRIAHLLHEVDAKLVARICAEYAHSKTGIDIHPGAQIGDAFFIDHGTGVVIGETCHVGDHVKVYQGVTLGALHVDKSMASKKRHPTIGDHVIIYANATILGGETVIGHHSVLGGNTWVTKSLEPWSLVQHTSEVRIRIRNEPSELNFTI
jgi:serine O-acetyltransferase